MLHPSTHAPVVQPHVPSLALTLNLSTTIFCNCDVIGVHIESRSSGKELS